jgi:4-hydroxybutyrate CoA-transferase
MADDYRQKIISADEAAAKIKSGDTVILSHAVNEPRHLVEAMVDHYQDYENVTVTHMISLGEGRYSKPDMKGHFKYVGMFTDKATRASIHEGQGDFLPVYFSEIPGLIRNGGIRADVVMLSVTPPDEDGNCHLGVSCDYTIQAAKSGKTVIAQINRNLPHVEGEGVIPVGNIDWLVEKDEPLPEISWGAPNDKDLAIGQYCASLIEDGSTLQLGMGGIPNAVLEALREKKNLGIHSEMISDGVVELVKAGAVNGSEKSIDKGRIVVNFLYGTKNLYDFVDQNPDIRLMPADYTNNPLVIRQNSKFVCINSAIEVDLWGQVAAGMVNGKIFSGVGGQVDFIRGAAMSADGKGKAIIAMHASAAKKDGTKISKIVGGFGKGTLVTTSQHDVDYVVTEFGIAALKGATVKERARRLIDIADPDFRDGLRRDFEICFNDSY